MRISIGLRVLRSTQNPDYDSQCKETDLFTLYLCTRDPQGVMLCIHHHASTLKAYLVASFRRSRIRARIESGTCHYELLLEAYLIIQCILFFTRLSRFSYCIFLEPLCVPAQAFAFQRPTLRLPAFTCCMLLRYHQRWLEGF